MLAVHLSYSSLSFFSHARYYNGGVLLDEIAVDMVQPPPRPVTVPQALQQSMPLADVLNLIAKPPGNAPPFIPYKPVRLSLCLWLCVCMLWQMC